MASGAVNDGVGSRSAADAGPVQPQSIRVELRDMAVTVPNILELARKHFNGDVVAAASALRKRGTEIYG
jgi:hypothetical protein